jgi:dienelactone hydrolase
MKPAFVVWTTLALAVAPSAQTPPAPRMVDLKAADGTVLNASYFAAATPGPGVLLFHQSNRTRRDWDALAAQLAAAGIHTLTIDMRGFGDTGGTPVDKRTDEEWKHVHEQTPGDIDAALRYLSSQPGVSKGVIGLGGAGVLGVDMAVGTARRHADEVKSLALLSGETHPDGREYLRQASQLPALFVVADDDEYPPIVEAMELLYITSTNPGRKLVHYSAAEEAPWLWYEPFDIGKVPAAGAHGTDLFRTHRELPGIIVQWFVTTLLKTPGHAPADTLACASTILEIEQPGGVARVTERLTEARRKDPQAQLFPEVTVSNIGQDHMRAHQNREAVEVLKLVLLAYPDSADAYETLAEAYLADGQKDLARQHAQKALALLETPALPASSWSDTEPRRGEIRKGAEEVLKTSSKAS